MTREELDVALAVGAAAARRAAVAGVRALGLGEMGIGNTTTAAALLTGLTGYSALVTVGRGTGVTDEGLARKRMVVDRACALHAAHLNGGLRAPELLRCLGGLELAAIVGAAIEAARHRIAVVADGFISTVAILCAARIVHALDDGDATNLAAALFFAHRSAEQGHGLALDACAALPGYDARPLLHLDMRLGEGSGAALAMPILRSAAAIMREMATFASAGVSTGEQAESHGAGRPG
jgi:nicotinate-nucleotide--dimethylbenzimidazole phosphoribosyltransferase